MRIDREFRSVIIKHAKGSEPNSRARPPWRTGRPDGPIAIFGTGVSMKKSLLLTAVLLTASCSKAPEAPPAAAVEKPAAIGSIARLDPALDQLVPKDAQIEKVAGGFTFIEGPLWRPSNALWFSDVVGNVVRQWTPDGKV